MTCSRQYQFVIILVFSSLSIISWLGNCTSPSVLSQCLIQHSCLLLLLFSFKFLLRAGLRAVQVVFDHRSSYMLDSLFSLSMVGMVTELASCVQFQGRVTIYFFRCRSSYVLRRSLPMFPVFSNLSDLNQKKV